MTVTRFSNGAIKDNLLATNTSFAASDMELISTIRVGSAGAASVTFSAIPQEFKHLQIRCVALSNRASTGDNLIFRFNGDTATNYADHLLYGTGASALSGNDINQAFANIVRLPAASIAANVFGAGVIDILDYSNSSKFKTARSIGGWDSNGNGEIWGAASGLWRSTAAVTSLYLSVNAGTLLQPNSKFSLYGIRG